MTYFVSSAIKTLTQSIKPALDTNITAN